MMSFRSSYLADLRLPVGTLWLAETVGECKGRQTLYERQSPQILKALLDLAFVESAESSNRIEGVTVQRDRLRPLVLGKARPRDRSEEEIVGYRRALRWVHTTHERIVIEPDAIKRLHALAQGGTSGDAGQWKRAQNDIIEVRPDGSRVVRFRPLPPEQVGAAMEQLCRGYTHAVDQQRVSPLVATACLVLDFLCVHPFRDGNGRVSRLLTLLALYHHGYGVGRYISLERIVEQTKDDYYDALKRSSESWHDGRHDLVPWINYFLSTLRMAYREFEERAGRERPARGAKADLVDYALENIDSPFAIAEVERLCPGVSRRMIRVVLDRWREAGRLEIVRRGRDARWRVIRQEAQMSH